MLFLYVLIGLLIVIVSLSVLAAFSVFRPRKFGYEISRQLELEKERFSSDYLSDFDIRDVSIERDGLSLHGHFINRNSDRSLILMHGHTYTLYGSYKYIKMFLDRGFNILMPDQRYHGLSEGRNCTLGWEESRDLHEWIAFMRKEIPENRILGLHGESMGAATVLLGGHHDAVDFVIEDCSFSKLKEEVADVIGKRYKLPGFLVYTTDFISRFLFKAPLLKINPVENVKNIKAPILFIHGDDDNYIGLDHFERLTANLKEKDAVYVCKGADHAKSFVTNPELYEAKVDAFLNSCKVL